MKKKQVKEILNHCEPSYAQQVKKGTIKPTGVKPKDPIINWHLALAFPLLHGGWKKLASKACSWVSCACGNQCSIIPRQHDGKPFDSELARLGTEFYGAILFKDKPRARAILADIELCSAELIQEIEFNKTYGVQM